MPLCSCATALAQGHDYNIVWTVWTEILHVSMVVKVTTLRNSCYAEAHLSRIPSFSLYCMHILLVYLINHPIHSYKHWVSEIEFCYLMNVEYLSSFSILRYCLQEIKVGSNYQAKLPEVRKRSSRSSAAPSFPTSTSTSSSSSSNANSSNHHDNGNSHLLGELVWNPKETTEEKGSLFCVSVCIYIYIFIF